VTAARRGSPPVGSDLVFARLVLVDVPARRRSYARRRASCARAGRYFHEADWLAHVSNPPLEAWNRLREAIEVYAAAAGVDLFIGRRLPRLLREAGLTDVRLRPIVWVFERGTSAARSCSTSSTTSTGRWWAGA
jgi:hypothetical protein